jgi:hypothetical protein
VTDDGGRAAVFMHMIAPAIHGEHVLIVTVTEVVDPETGQHMISYHAATAVPENEHGHGVLAVAVRDWLLGKTGQETS